MQYTDESGRTMTEYFTSKEEMDKKQKLIEELGGKVIRKVELHTNPKYPEPHQGAQEIERMRRQQEKLNAKLAAEQAKSA